MVSVTGEALLTVPTFRLPKLRLLVDRLIEGSSTGALAVWKETVMSSMTNPPLLVCRNNRVLSPLFQYEAGVLIDTLAEMELFDETPWTPNNDTGELPFMINSPSFE